MILQLLNRYNHKVLQYVQFSKLISHFILLISKKILIPSHIILIMLCVVFCPHSIKGQKEVFMPFLDDFSSYKGQPNNSLWQNSSAIVNQGFQFFPPTVGVVTLDILDNKGEIFPQASIYGFVADTLCSVSIRMDSIKEPVIKRLTQSDSIWLSFFIQPTGAMGNLWERIGSAPSTKDSIILQFYASRQGVWNTVWRMNGTDVETIYKKDSVYFLQYLIPITDTAYFNKDFRFRFINYGSLNNNPSFSYISNKGGWNIDYIYMNINRSYKDNTYRDVAFVNPASSFLKNFTSIPAKHFKKEYMKDSVYNTIVNLHSSVLNSNYSYFIVDKNKTPIHSYLGGFENIDSYPKTHKFQTQKNHTSFKIDFSFEPDKNAWSEYIITHVVTEGVGQDNIRYNDTTRFVQKFENYFSYDDGTAESGIGIEPSNSSLFAVGYPLLVQDSLYAVDIYFNCSWQQSNLKPFYLCIYNAKEQITIHKDNDGKEIKDTTFIPDQLLYESARLVPQYDSLNKFHRYFLDETLILPAGMFFVALKPSGSAYMNIGFDQNNDASPFMFEKKGKDWINIFLKGSPMIRPYFGYRSVGLQETIRENESLTVYPNPSKYFISLRMRNIDKTKENKIIIINSYGQIVYCTDVPNDYDSLYEKTIDISNLNNGIYMLRVGNQTKKLIIAR